MLLDSSGSVGIGCTPDSTVSVDVQNLSASSNNVFLRIKNSTNLEDSGLIIEGQNGGAREYKIGVNSIANTSDLTFSGPTGYRYYIGSTLAMSIDSSGNLSVSGGVYLGGTGSANLLDDYEEGTFTPTVTVDSGSVGSVAASGSYIKIGRSVTVSIYISIGTASGALINQVGNIPFTPENTNQQAVGSVRENATAGDQWHLRATKNSTDFLLRRYDNNQSISAGDQFLGSVTFFTA
jgi:hypothetical protein